MSDGSSSQSESAPPLPPPPGERSHRTRLLTYGISALVFAALFVFLLTTDTFLNDGRGRGDLLYVVAPVVAVLQAIRFVRELLGRPPIVFPLGRRARG